MNQKALTFTIIALALVVLGFILFADTCEEDGCYRLTSALRWLGRALQML